MRLLLVILLLCLLANTLAIRGAKKSQLHKRLDRALEGEQAEDGKAAKDEKKVKDEKATKSSKANKSKKASKEKKSEKSSKSKKCKKAKKSDMSEKAAYDSEEEAIEADEPVDLEQDDPNDPALMDLEQDDPMDPSASMEETPYCLHGLATKEACDAVRGGQTPKEGNNIQGDLTLDITHDEDTSPQQVLESVKRSLQQETPLQYLGCSMTRHLIFGGKDAETEDNEEGEAAVEEEGGAEEEEYVSLTGVDFGEPKIVKGT